jgi:hypothetical protein
MAKGLSKYCIWGGETQRYCIDLSCNGECLDSVKEDIDMLYFMAHKYTADMDAHKYAASILRAEYKKFNTSDWNPFSQNLKEYAKQIAAHLELTTRSNQKIRNLVIKCIGERKSEVDYNALTAKYNDWMFIPERDNKET